MSISITINDPANTRREELRLVIDLLEQYHDGNQALLPTTLEPADSPDVGTPVLTAEQAFGQNPAQVFTPPAGTHGSADLDADAAKLEALAGPGAAGMVFTPPATAPFTAGAAPLPTVPAALPATLPPLPNVNVPPAPPAGNAAPVVAAGAAPAPGVELDSAGLPWDARIHAASKIKIANGTWKAKRNVDEATVAQVQAQLRQALAAPAPGGFAGGVVSPGQPMPPIPAPITAGTAPGIIPTAPDGAAPTDSTNLIQQLAPMMASNEITQADIALACQSVGLADLTQVFLRPDLVPGVWAAVQGIRASKGLA